MLDIGSRFIALLTTIALVAPVSAAQAASHGDFSHRIPRSTAQAQRHFTRAHSAGSTSRLRHFGHHSW